LRDKSGLNTYCIKKVRFAMIKLSKLTDYAFVTLVAMAERPVRNKGVSLLSASQLAGMTHLPEPTVSKVLKLLSKKDVIVSVRGAKGGYNLAHDPAQILISDVIAAIEGPIALTSCVKGSDDSCAIEDVCRMNGRWNVVNKAIKAALDEVTLADMMPPRASQPVENEEENEERVAV